MASVKRRPVKSPAIILETACQPLYITHTHHYHGDAQGIVAIDQLPTGCAWFWFHVVAPMGLIGVFVYVIMPHAKVLYCLVSTTGQSVGVTPAVCELTAKDLEVAGVTATSI